MDHPRWINRLDRPFESQNLTNRVMWPAWCEATSECRTGVEAISFVEECSGAPACIDMRFENGDIITCI